MIPVLEVRDLHKNFDQLNVLCGLQLRANQGDIVGLVGPNGSGKTTLLNLISGFESIDSGNIIVGGTDITAWPTWRRAHTGIGRCFQDSRLWNDLNLGEHLQLVANTHQGRQSSARMDAITALVKLDADTLNKYPDDIPLMHRRRLELIMAALSGSHLLLIDEIGAGLNLAEARAIYDCVSALVDQRLVGAVLMIEHRLGLVEEYSTTIGMMKDGLLMRTEHTARDDFVTAVQDMFEAPQIHKKEISQW